MTRDALVTHTSGLSGTQISPPAGTACARPWQVITPLAIILVEVSIAEIWRAFEEEYFTLSLIVQKFGGTSVANAQRIMAAARRAIRTQQEGNQVIVVVSARGDTTDELISLACEISDQPPAREMDMLLATGEQISIALMAMAIQSLGQP